MAQEQGAADLPGRRPLLSLDWWAVLAALVLAALVLVGLIPNVPW